MFAARFSCDRRSGSREKTGRHPQGCDPARSPLPHRRVATTTRPDAPMGLKSTSGSRLVATTDIQDRSPEATTLGPPPPAETEDRACAATASVSHRSDHRTRRETATSLCALPRPLRTTTKADRCVPAGDTDRAPPLLTMLPNRRFLRRETAAAGATAFLSLPLRPGRVADRNEHRASLALHRSRTALTRCRRTARPKPAPSTKPTEAGIAVGPKPATAFSAAAVTGPGSCVRLAAPR